MDDFANDCFASDDLVNDLYSIVNNEHGFESNKQADDLNQNNESSANEPNLNENGSDFDSELDEYEEMANDEIDKLLEGPLDVMTEKDDVNFYTYDKVQIKSIYWRGLHDTMLPEGWVQMTHACGMPLYLHRQTRVCTLSRPYFIGQSSARKHDMPMSAIPCLAYQNRKEAIEKQMKDHQAAKSAACKYSNKIEGADPNVSIDAPAATATTTTNGESQDNGQNPLKRKLNQKVTVSIQSNEEKSKENVLPPEKIHEYCKRLFEFDVIKVKKFKTWNDRKKFMRKKTSNKKFPENAKVLKIQTKTQKGIQRDLTINLTNKTPLTILYEYASQAFKSNPRFEIQEKENPKDPFQACCYIDDQLCGKGNGNSKKVAKNNAANEALKVLIPDYKGAATENTKTNTDDTYAFFDGYSVEHSHVLTLSQSLGAPLPYDVLLTCLKYNFALNISRNRQELIEEEIKAVKFRTSLYRMKLAQYEVEVNCTNKKEGRQYAAQKILKLMHPQVQTWGSMLRLYGSKVTDAYVKPDDSVSEAKNQDADKKQAEEHKPKPNTELLEKLKEEMRKIRKSNNTIGTMRLNLQAAMHQDTLLTIPALILPNSKNDEVDQPQVNDEANETSLHDESLVIKFSDDFKSNKQMTSLNRIISDSDGRNAAKCDEAMDD